MPSWHEQRQLHFQIIGNYRESVVIGLPWRIGNFSGSCVVRVVYTADTCKYSYDLQSTDCSRPAHPPVRPTARSSVCPSVYLKHETARETLKEFSWNVTLVMFTTSRKVTALWIASDNCDLMCMLRRKCLLKQGTEGTIERKGWRGRRRKRLLNDLKNENVLEIERRGISSRSVENSFWKQLCTLCKIDYVVVMMMMMMMMMMMLIKIFTLPCRLHPRNPVNVCLWEKWLQERQQ
jgi:hypothetical protein